MASRPHATEPRQGPNLEFCWPSPARDQRSQCGRQNVLSGWAVTPWPLNPAGSLCLVLHWVPPRLSLRSCSACPPATSACSRWARRLAGFVADARCNHVLRLLAGCQLAPRLRSVAQLRAADEDGAAARRRKEERYPELHRPGPQRLVVLACETGRRWCPEVRNLVNRLVRLRALRAPQAVRRAAEAGGRCSAPPCNAPSLPL